MTVLDWPQLPAADRDALRAGLRRLLTEVMDGELHALGNLDDLLPGRWRRWPRC
jgi:hypothetical protein